MDSMRDKRRWTGRLCCVALGGVWRSAQKHLQADIKEMGNCNCCGVGRGVSAVAGLRPLTPCICRLGSILPQLWNVRYDEEVYRGLIWTRWAHSN